MNGSISFLRILRIFRRNSLASGGMIVDTNPKKSSDVIGLGFWVRLKEIVLSRCMFLFFKELEIFRGVL